MFLLLASTTSDGIFFVETCPKHSGWSHYEEIQVHLNWHSSPERFPESDVQAHNLLAMYVELNRKMHSQQQWSFYLSSRKNRTAKIVAQTSLICPDSPTKHCRCGRFGKWKVEECCLLSLIEMGRCFALIHCWIKSKILFSSVHSTRRWLVFSLCRAFLKFCSDSAPLSWFMGFQMQSYAAAKTPSLRSAFFVKKVNNIIGITNVSWLLRNSTNLMIYRNRKLFSFRNFFSFQKRYFSVYHSSRTLWPFKLISALVLIKPQICPFSLNILVMGKFWPAGHKAKRDVFLQMALKNKINGTLCRKTPHAFERKQIEIRNI